jgi:membrane protease YdiL (CAAX protease family)
MTAPEPAGHAPPNDASERGAALALLPIAATLDYYLLPEALQAQTLIQFIPQILAYGAIALWAAHNSACWSRLGLFGTGIVPGLRWGLVVGFLLGGVNTFVILTVAPALGVDISFLKDIPHAQIPILIMVPWFIVGIALFVEVNFRGFLLGRLVALESALWPAAIGRCSPLALVASALTFAFDPFMVNTFKQLHWIAVWDGLIWGVLWLGTRNLWITIVAHAVEVTVMYLAVRAALD